MSATSLRSVLILGINDTREYVLIAPVGEQNVRAPPLVPAHPVRSTTWPAKAEVLRQCASEPRPRHESDRPVQNRFEERLCPFLCPPGRSRGFCTILSPGRVPHVCVGVAGALHGLNKIGRSPSRCSLIGWVRRISSLFLVQVIPG